MTTPADLRGPTRAGTRRGWAWFLLGWHCTLAAALAQAPNPSEASAFFREYPALQFIEQRLPGAVTVVIPPDAAQARQVVTDRELQAAFGGVLDDFLAPPSTFAGKAKSLTAELCRYRPAQAADWVAVAACSILRHKLPTAEADLTDAVAAAVAANPRAAGAVVRETIRRIAARAAAGTSQRQGRLDRETAARYVDGVVFTAATAVKSGPAAGPAIREIMEQALQEALRLDAADFAVEVMVAAVRAGRDVEGAKVSDLARMALAKYGQSKLQAGIICAGLLKGAGAEAVSGIKDEAALNLPVAISASATIACNAYVAVAAAPPSAALTVSRFVVVTNADYIPAVMIGAIVANPQATLEILEAGLNRDLVLHGRATTSEIVEAAVLASPQRAPQLAAVAVGRGDLMEGDAPAQIAEGVARGAPAAEIGAAISAQLRTQRNTAEVIKATVAGAMTGAAAAQKLSALSAISFAAATADQALAGDVLDQVLISTPPELQYAGVAGVLAASLTQARALLDRALKHSGLAPGQSDPISACGAVILDIQADATAFLRAATRRLGASEKLPPIAVKAIVLGTAMANPRSGPAVAAAAVAATDESPEVLVAILAEIDPSVAPQVERAVESAIHVKRGTGDLFPYLRGEIAMNPDHASEIVTGALAVAPSLSHVVGRATAVATPATVAKMIPRLFAFSDAGESSDGIITLTSGVIGGIVDAGLEPASERRAIADTVATAVRLVAAIRRKAAGASSEGEAISAVITAAIAVAPGYTIEIAQSSTRAARSISCTAGDLAILKAALLAAAPRTEAGRISDAIAAGIAEADRQLPAANVRSLVDHAHDSLTGTPMTFSLDL